MQALELLLPGQSDRKLVKGTLIAATKNALERARASAIVREVAIVKIVLPSPVVLWLRIFDVYHVAITVARRRQQVDVRRGKLLRGLSNYAGLLQFFDGVAVLHQPEVRFAVLPQRSVPRSVADSLAITIQRQSDLSLKWSRIGTHEPRREKLVEGCSGDGHSLRRLYADPGPADEAIVGVIAIEKAVGVGIG